MNNVLFKSPIDIHFEEIRNGDNIISSPDGSLNVIVMNGPKGAVIWMNGNNRINLSPYTLFLAGKDSEARISLPEEGKAIVLYFDYVGKYCDSKVCAFLEKNSPEFSNSFSMLPMNEALKSYYTVMESSMTELFDEIVFREIKYKEFFFLLCKWLLISDFAEFLHPAMSWYDPVFRRKVMDNYQKSYRVKTLAADCGYTEIEFNEKFKNEFGVTPGRWLKEQISKVIEKRLSNPHITLQEISEELQMSSVQSFSRFCKKNFGMPPGKIREGLTGK